jgi:hypothetical protein
VRACILSQIPGDVIDAAMAQANATLHAKADTSPEAIQKIIAAFEPFGVTKEHIEKRIQRRLDAIQPAQVVTLKRIYASLRDGMSAPSEWFEMAEVAEAGSTTTLKDIASKHAAQKANGKTKKPEQSVSPAIDAIVAEIDKATDVDVLDLAMDGFRSDDALSEDDKQRVEAAYQNRREILLGA